MKKFIATKSTTVTCVYGRFNMVEGNPVPEYIANLFPQYVKEDVQEEEQEEETTNEKTTKKGKK